MAPRRPARADPAWLALDLGTTFFKGAVLDLRRGRIGSVIRLPAPGPLRGRPPGHHELEPRAVVAAALRLLRSLLRRAPAPLGLVVSAQMHALVLTDEAGRPLGPIVTWQDQRAREIHPSGQGSFLDVLRERAGAEAEAATGRELWAGRPVSVLFWMRETGRLSERAVPRSLPDLVLAAIGVAPRAVGLTHAAASGALDLARGRWHETMLGALGLDALAWPEVAAPTETVGRLDLGGRPVPVLAPLGDQQAALLGAGLGAGELSLNVATGCQVTRITAEPRIGPHQCRPHADGRWLATVIHVPAGRSLAALVRLLGELAEAEGVRLRRPWATIERAATRLPGTDVVADLAFFPSARGERGALLNLREETLTAGHVFRAALEAIVRGLRDAAARIAPRGDWQRVVLSGGLIHQSRLLRRLIEDAFPGSRRVGPPEDALTGLLRLAQAGSRHGPGLRADPARLPVGAGS